MIGSTQSSQAADITSLAVRVGNLKAGIQAPAGMAGTNETKRDRDDAVLVSERTRQLAEAVAQQQNASDTADDSGTSGGQRTRSAGRQEMLASASTHYSGMVLNRSFPHDAMRLYSETGKAYSVQPTGHYETSAQTLEAWGGAEGYMASLQKHADNITKVLEDTETLIAEL